MYREFDIAQCRLHNLAVRRGKEDEESCEDLTLHVGR